MNKLSEEEISDRMILIINGYKECLDYNCNQTEECQREIKYDIETLETMIDLYNKEKEKVKELEDVNKKLYDLAHRQAMQQFIENDYISKDKIKKALGIEEDITEDKLLSLLDTLMSEVDRLEDIEDKKIQIECQNVFNKGVKSVKDKIKEIIKDIDETLNITKSDEAKFFISGLKNSLQELLEE